VKDSNPSYPTQKNQIHTFRRSEWAEVRGLEEIKSTLDAEGKLDGLPFMPEMAKYCGKIFSVSHRADRVFLDRLYYVAQLKDTVFLENIRCDGQAHDGCQMRCQLFWKEQWLKPAILPSPCPDFCGDHREAVVDKKGTVSLISIDYPTRRGSCFTCQATELVRASNRLPWWDPRQYVRDIIHGETTIRELFVDYKGRAKQKVFRLLQRNRKPVEYPISQPTPTESLKLQPGEWVEVKSLAEIQATLDANGKNRGLGFAPDQAEFCGKRYCVAGRVDKLIQEWSGEMQSITNTVELESVNCNGRLYRSCPRNCYHLWREIWLRREKAPE
jgi:hypothetical protein